MRPGPEELALVGAAVRALRHGRGPELHPTAAAVRTADGRTVAALGLGGRCAEPAALAAALALGQPVRALAAVRHVDADSTRVTTPCGPCRDLLRQHAPGLQVVHLADGLHVAPLAALPPA